MREKVTRLASILWREIAERVHIDYKPITTRDELILFLDKNSAYVAQKCAYAYCHARMGKLAYDAMEESLFQDKMEVCRWEGYAFILSDLVLRLFFFLNEDKSNSTPDRQPLQTLYRDVLARHRVPAHRKDWEDHYESFRLRLAAASESLARGEGIPAIKHTADIGARALLGLVPLIDPFKALDRDIFFSTVRLAEMNFDSDLRKRYRIEQRRFSTSIAIGS